LEARRNATGAEPLRTKRIGSLIANSADVRKEVYRDNARSRLSVG
jgi:hypothetical protein